MPAVSFRREWAAQVRYGAALAAGDLALAAQVRADAGSELLPKRSTVRRAGRARAGEVLHLFVDQRQPTCARLGTVVCLGVTPLALAPDTAGFVLDGRSLTAAESEAFARLDTAGQWDAAALWGFFRATYADAPLALYLW